MKTSNESTGKASVILGGCPACGGNLTGELTFTFPIEVGPPVSLQAKVTVGAAEIVGFELNRHRCLHGKPRAFR